MSTVTIVLLVILVILIAAVIALYFFGKKAQKKQDEQQAQIQANKQTVSMLSSIKTDAAERFRTSTDGHRPDT